MADLDIVAESADLEALHARIDRDRTAYVTEAKKQNADAVSQYRAYAAGNQPRTLTDGQKEILAYLVANGAVDNLFADNVCHQIVAEAADRLELLRFQAEDAAVADFLQAEVFVKNHLSDLMGETHYATLRDGNFCLLAAWSDTQARVLLYREDWWDGETGMFVAYDEQAQAQYAVKEWQDADGNWRRNVWLSDRLMRFRSIGKARWEPFSLPEDAAWPVPLVKADGRPMGLPVLHFANAGRGPSDYGVSELAGGVLGFQDQVNDLQYAISACARMTGYQMVTATGMTLPVDATTRLPRQPTIGPGAFLVNPNTQGASWGHIPAGDVEKLIETYRAKLQAVCRMTRTPLHLLTGNWPSGEALLRAELPAVNKAARQVAKFRGVWASVGHLCTEIANAYGPGPELNEEATVTAEFASVDRLGPLAQSMAEAAFWDAADKAVTAGLPLETFLRRAGWSEEELESLATARAAQIQLEQEDVLPPSNQ